MEVYVHVLFISFNINVKHWRRQIALVYNDILFDCESSESIKREVYHDVMSFDTKLLKKKFSEY